eukprot:Trichotokara_eunicae@DN5830_c0_g1_i10.p1
MWNTSTICSSEFLLRLSLDELTFQAEHFLTIDVLSKVNLPVLRCPLVGEIGPLIRGRIHPVPLFVVPNLVREGLASPVIPFWLTEEGLNELVRSELENTHIKPPPHPNFVEVARLMFSSNQNPWHDQPKAFQVRLRTLQLFQDYLNARRRKLLELSDKLQNEGCVDVSNVSKAELSKIAFVGPNYTKQLEFGAKLPEEPLENILRYLNVFD